MHNVGTTMGTTVTRPDVQTRSFLVTLEFGSKQAADDARVAMWANNPDDHGVLCPGLVNGVHLLEWWVDAATLNEAAGRVWGAIPDRVFTAATSVQIQHPQPANVA